MIRRVINIDEEKCNGCGICVNACHEGAIGLVDGKAKLLRDDYCDGLGDCLPTCPTGAITFVEREAAAYDEAAVKENMRKKAEARIIEEIRPFITGEFTVTDIKRARLSELFFNENGDRFYKIKVYFITLDEKSGAEKKTAAQMLAQATTLKEAIAVLEDGMKGTLADYTIASVTETQLMDVFPFDANSIPGEKKSGEELIAEQKQQAEQRG